MVLLLFALLVSVFIGSVVFLLLEMLMTGSLDETNSVHSRVEGLVVHHSHAGVRKDVGSRFPKFGNAFARQRLSERLTHLLNFTGLTMTSGQFVLMDAVWGMLVLIISRIMMNSNMLAIGLSSAAMFIPYFFLILKKRRYIEKFSTNFPDALLLMKSSIRAGQGVQTAFQMVAEEGPEPVAREFSQVVREMELGSHLNEALNELYKRIGTIDLRIFVLGIFIQHEVGGNLAELFEHIEKTIRDRMATMREMKALSAQGKMSGIVLMALPIALALMMLSMNPAYFDPLLKSQVGQKILWISLVLQGIGAYIIRKLTYIKMV
ncbi:MAG: type II secretion system F family protein [Candidatus Omnitrophota bacterium]|nr:type II secretion system F family protein [Candidatus Omnitrophota bacterium]